MGYTSDVKAVIKFPEQVIYSMFVAKLKTTMLKFDPNDPASEEVSLWETLNLENLDDEFEIRLEAGGKWYDDFPEVQAWEETMRSAGEAGAGYRFVRVGEDMDDNEIEEGDIFKVNGVYLCDIVDIERRAAWR